MIAGKSLDDIARALRMAVDQEGRPAFKAEDVEAILNVAVGTSFYEKRIAVLIEKG